MINKFPILLITFTLLISCNSKSKELEKMKNENDKLKGEVQKMEKDKSDVEYRKKYVVAMNEVKTIGFAIESYVTDWSKPPVHASIREMAADTKFVPFYIKQMPVTDPWGNEYHYKYSAEGEYGTYWVGCGGSDGIFNGFDQIGHPELQPNIDIIFSNGEFKLAAK
jgi:hypothetical protein